MFVPIPIKADGEMYHNELVVVLHDDEGQRYVAHSALNGWRATGDSPEQALRKYIRSKTGEDGRNYKLPGARYRNGRPASYRTCRRRLVLDQQTSQALDDIAAQWGVDPSTVVSYLVLRTLQALTDYRRLPKEARQQAGKLLRDFDPHAETLRLLYAREYQEK